MVKYYSTQRPVMPGGYPKKGAVERIQNFDTKTFCEEVGREAWGFIEYREPLTKEEADAYEMTLAGMKTFWCVNTSTSTSRKDIYNDWFEDHEEAEKFVEEARSA